MNVLRSLVTASRPQEVRGKAGFGASSVHGLRAKQARVHGQLLDCSAANYQSFDVNSHSLQAPVVKWKRAFDIVVALMAAPMAIVICSFAGLLILIGCGGPVFFTQDRTGLLGRPFRIYKLRTMFDGGANVDPTQPNDPRITPLGAVLRKYRIDELPQLLNVLRGDMSIVGPRPEQPHLVDRYRRAIPHFDDRHLVKPGITGLAQVQYHYAADAAETRIKLRYDRIYVRRQSFLLDMWILMRTVMVILNGFGSR